MSDTTITRLVLKKELDASMQKILRYFDKRFDRLEVRLDEQDKKLDRILARVVGNDADGN